ncbi:MAG TPA: hypothetical protein VJQ52_24605 [Steroidobacteraceae bacterium]|nr:hypothetical protein [Steroidobacteraceae bacterium]
MRIVALLALTGAFTAAAAASPLPEVYSDEFVAIRAGIPDAGVAPRHIGDRLEFVLQVEFASQAVRIEELDQTFFQRSFASVPAFRNGQPPQLTRGTDDDKQVLTASWSFQVVECPDTRVACPGSKTYLLPPLSLSYEVLDDAGKLVNNRSARFRPWPVAVVISPVISTDAGPGSVLTEFFPGGAYPEPVTVATHSSRGVVAMLGGVLLLSLSYIPLVRREQRPLRRATAPTTSRRWEQLFHRLQSSDLADDRWADAFRRCLTQYCEDELQTNPYEWFDSAARDSRAPSQAHGQWRKLFHDVLQHEAIPASERAALLARFSALAQLPPA